MAYSKPEGVNNQPVYFIREMKVLVDVEDNKSVKSKSMIDCIEMW